eukprot:2383777-Prymnesium_polylepis.1
MLREEVVRRPRWRIGAVSGLHEPDHGLKAALHAPRVRDEPSELRHLRFGRRDGRVARRCHVAALQLQLDKRWSRFLAHLVKQQA